MIKFSIPRDHTVIVTYDDGKTKLADIQKALNKGGFTSEGKMVPRE